MTMTKAKRRRTLIAFLCAVLLITTFLPSAAFAYLQNPSASVLFDWNKYITNSSPRITVYGRNPGTGSEDNRTISGMNGLNGHYLYIGGWKPVYCLNPDQPADSNYIDGSSVKATRWGRLTADQQDLILRALSCGYPITTDSSIQTQTGTFSLTAESAQHLATQAMIFNIRCNFIVKNGNGIISTKDYNSAENMEERVSPDYANFHTAYANLFARMNNFTPSVGIPSFATLSTETAGADKTIKLDLDPATGNYTASVTDTNGVLGYYNFAGMSGGGISYSVSGNTLTITATPSAAEALGTPTRKGDAVSSAADANLGIDNLTFYIKGGGGTDNYKDNADTIIGNMDSSIFLGGKEPTTLKELSTALGKETIDTYNTGESRGREVSHSLNYQKLGKELMSIDELAVLDGGKCILQLRGVRPFLSDKYDITKHPNYKYTSDYDERNAFNVQEYLQHRLKLKENEVYSVYEEDVAAEKE